MANFTADDVVSVDLTESEKCSTQTQPRKSLFLPKGMNSWDSFHQDRRRAESSRAESSRRGGQGMFLSTCLSTEVFFFFNLSLFLAVLGLRFCARAFSSCGERGPLFITVRGPLHCRSPSCCGAQAPDVQAQ